MPNTAIRPLSDNVVIRRNDADDRSPGGVYLPTDAQEKPNCGRVLAVGPGHLLKDGKRATMEVQEGDTVYFPHHACHEIEINNEKLLVVREPNLIAKVTQ